MPRSVTKKPAAKKAAASRKRLNAPTTKASILKAAQTVFAKHGYSKAGIREIAAVASVSSTLLLRYFGSKRELFEAALGEAIPLQQLFSLPDRAAFGGHVLRMVLETVSEIGPTSIVALSLGDADAQKVALRLTEERLIGPLADWLGGQDGHARAWNILMLIIGFMLYARAQDGKVDAALAKRFVGTVQGLVD